MEYLLAQRYVRDNIIAITTLYNVSVVYVFNFFSKGIYIVGLHYITHAGCFSMVINLSKGYSRPVDLH